MRDFYLGLVHYPVTNKNKEIITSAITNFDIHDIARAAKTFGVKKYFIISPEDGQKKVMNKIITHWKDGFGASYNSDRKDALEIVDLIDSIDETIDLIKKETKLEPMVLATSAKNQDYENYTINELKSILNSEGEPILLLFGTGYGMSMKDIPQISYLLEPILGVGDYNHLSVRSAVSIYLFALRK